MFVLVSELLNDSDIIVRVSASVALLKSKCSMLKHVNSFNSALTQMNSVIQSRFFITEIVSPYVYSLTTSLLRLAVDLSESDIEIQPLSIFQVFLLFVPSY